MPVPEIRIASANQAPVNHGGEYVLYWMIAARRPFRNFALERAVEWASRLGKPLVVLEPLRQGYEWASDRLHAFVLEGMAANANHFADSRAFYHPYVERQAGEGKGLLEAVARSAAVVVTDDFPAFFLRRMVAAAAGRVQTRLEAVDSNGLVPLRATERTYPSAYAFRVFLQKTLRAYLTAFPEADPLAGLTGPRLADLPAEITTRWPSASRPLLETPGAHLAALPIDHRVSPVSETVGGFVVARSRLRTFLEKRLVRYPDERNQPQEEVASGLSPYLHFGHISAHEIFAELMTREGWTTRALGTRASGKREGWWGASQAAESFLDEVVTWREVGFNMCHHRADYDRYDSLPDWARATLAKHASDRRQFVYTLDGFESAATHDPLWNAAQVQLRQEGRIHNYLRMLWGKKILEWSPTPQDALAVMIELNNKYALDGRDPNSYSGIFWVLGRYDRPWGPERPIFGSVRYMSSDNTARKVRVRDYLARYAP